MFLWKWFYDPSPQGLFNTLISFLGIEPQLWLNDSRLAMLCIIIPGIWAGAGPGSIIYLAALKSIPEDMYEAADVDGAGIWTKIRHIVFPSLKPLIIINFVGAFIGAFKAMENVFVMTGGGPNYATHVMGLDIWHNAFLYLKFGFATAEAWIMGSMLIGFTMYQLRILKDLRFSAAGRT
jgi:multiple sugar transport system permease protein